METPWIEEKQLRRALQRNQAFWRKQMDGDCPLFWITAPLDKPSRQLPAIASESEIWTNTEYVIESADDALGRTYFAGDALPLHVPTLGPDQFAAWLGGELTFKPREHNTSWTRPFVEDWEDYPQLRIDPDNHWWKLYMDLTKASAEAGKGKWITAYPDLHSGADCLSAIRGADRLMTDMLMTPEVIERAMGQLTRLWKGVVDQLDPIILAAGQGTTNWTGGWSEQRFLCIGQNDSTCMISPKMYRDFFWEDNNACCNHVDQSLYHLDGHQAAIHLPAILEYEHLDAVQWIPGAGAPPPSHYLEMLRRIQQAGKMVQCLLVDVNGITDPFAETEILCRELDPQRLFLVADVNSADEANALLNLARRTCAARRPAQVAKL